MSQPDWTKRWKRGHNVLVVWEYGTGANRKTYRFGLHAKWVKYAKYNKHNIERLPTTPDGLGHNTYLSGYYHNCLVDIGPLRQGCGTEVNPKIVFPDFTFSINRDKFDETKEFVEDLKTTNHFMDSAIPGYVRVYLTMHGSEPDPVEDLMFVGVPYNDSIKVYPDKVTVRLTDRLATVQSKSIATTEFDKSTYSLPQFGADENKPVPVVYGTFAADYMGTLEWLDCVILEEYSTGTSDWRVQFCQAAGSGLYAGTPQTVVRYDQNGAVVNEYNLDPSPGGATNSAYTTGVWGLTSPTMTDTPWNSGHSLKMDQFFGMKNSSGDLINNPAETWYHILRTFGGLTDSDIDDSWEDVRDYFDAWSPSIQTNILIDEPTSVIDVLGKLCKECNLLMFTRRGKFKLLLGPAHEQTILSTNVAYREDDFIMDGLSYGMLNIVSGQTKGIGTICGKVFYNLKQSNGEKPPDPSTGFIFSDPSYNSGGGNYYNMKTQKYDGETGYYYTFDIDFTNSVYGSGGEFDMIDMMLELMNGRKRLFEFDVNGGFMPYGIGSRLHVRKRSPATIADPVFDDVSIIIVEKETDLVEATGKVRAIEL